MATPGRETRQSSLRFDGELCGEGMPRQRSRRLPGEGNDDSIAWELIDDGRPKTRRVNPQRLALRLGPELVAEMEAYIVPGAKMPPFSIRKDFQERYSVDRRHIYDYFHSRGLRVAKEDKHTNLIRGRAMKAKGPAQGLLVPQTPSKPSSEATEGPTVDKMQSLSTPKFANKEPRPTKRTTKIRERKSAVVRRSTASIQPVKRSRGSVRAMLGEVPSESGGELSVSETDNDRDGIPISPQFTLPSDSSDESIVTSAASDFLPSPNGFLAGFFGGPDLPQFFSDMESFPVDEKPAVDQEHLMSQGERAELYDLISGSMSSSSTAESWNALISIDNTNRGSRLYHHEIPGKTHLTCSTSLNGFEPSHCDSHDLKRWLLDDLDLRQSAMDTHFLPSSRDSLDGYPGFYEAPIVNNGYASDYSQTAILSPQNRLPFSKAPNPVACVKQIADHAKKDAENMHPGTYFNSR